MHARLAAREAAVAAAAANRTGVEEQERERVKMEVQRRQMRMLVPNAEAFEAKFPRTVATYDSLRPIAKTLVRWRLIRFYGLSRGRDVMEWRLNGKGNL